MADHNRWTFNVQVVGPRKRSGPSGASEPWLRRSRRCSHRPCSEVEPPKRRCRACFTPVVVRHCLLWALRGPVGPYSFDCQRTLHLRDALLPLVPPSSPATWAAMMVPQKFMQNLSRKGGCVRRVVRHPAVPLESEIPLATANT